MSAGVVRRASTLRIAWDDEGVPALTVSLRRWGLDSRLPSCAIARVGSDTAGRIDRSGPLTHLASRPSCRTT